jgi:hypothetical protein
MKPTPITKTPKTPRIKNFETFFLSTFLKLKKFIVGDRKR